MQWVQATAYEFVSDSFSFVGKNDDIKGRVYNENYLFLAALFYFLYHEKGGDKFSSISWLKPIRQQLFSTDIYADSEFVFQYWLH